MSISAVSAAFKASQEVNGARRWTLLILCEYADDEGYSYPKVSTICRRAAISRDETVREALRWLEAEGYIERIINGWAGVKGDIPEGKRPNLYRIHLSSIGAPTGPKTVREPGAGATQKTGRSPTQKTGRSDYPENGEQNRHSEPPHEPTTPTPPEEGKSSTLFDPPPELRSEKVKRSRRKKGLDPISEAQFQKWWDRYPRKGRGGPGSPDRARVAWGKQIQEGATSAELDRQLSNYRAARQVFERLTGDPCWLLAAPKFLKEQRLEFDSELSEQEVRDRWNIRVTRDRKPPAVVMMNRSAHVEWLEADEARRREIEVSFEEVAAHG